MSLVWLFLRLISSIRNSVLFLLGVFPSVGVIR